LLIFLDRIMFMREFPVIDSATSVEQLRRRIKAEELEQFGAAFTPDFIYEAIRKLSRFDGMRRGHQQDAEEFLGFLLESLHEECAHVISAAFGGSPTSAAPAAPAVTAQEHGGEAGDGWLEVGHRQRAAVTRSSGHSHISTPITKIFGGQLRSELRVPGLKDSVTLEPYQPLQLDIQSPNVRNIVDALKGLTRPETLHGDFNSPRGKDVTATKTVYIESLPPVLILHLKRFQFDAEGNGGSTVKIWKKVGYPLELEIPREVFSRQKRNSVLAEGGELPRYRLITVVYHHGKNASGGHYTVDVRRQDGREWIRLDDTVIRRVHADDVAEGGAEEKDGTRTPDSVGRRDGTGGSVTPSAIGNRFSGMGSDNGDGAEDGNAGDEDGGEWRQVSGSAAGHGKKWSTVVNGASVAAATAAGPGAVGAKAKAQTAKENVRDNKVAYLLFYQRV
jgi:ubiquitin carboxyl-terminal hydrolase 10